MERISLGLMVKAQRKKCGYTTEELAKKVGINRSYITRFENENIYPTAHIFEKIADELTAGVNLKKLRYNLKKRYYSEKYPHVVSFVTGNIVALTAKEHRKRRSHIHTSINSPSTHLPVKLFK